jgi:hypothetical protein
MITGSQSWFTLHSPAPPFEERGHGPAPAGERIPDQTPVAHLAHGVSRAAPHRQAAAPAAVPHAIARRLVGHQNEVGQTVAVQPEPAGAPTDLRVRQRQLVESESGAVQRRPESRKRASKQPNTPYAPPGPGSRGRAPGARVSPRHTRRGRAQRPQAVLVSNNPYEGGDIGGLSRRARLDQGVLGGGDRASSGRTDPSIERPIEEVAAALPHGPGAVG